jgi:hypothetical protein
MPGSPFRCSRHFCDRLWVSASRPFSLPIPALIPHSTVIGRRYCRYFKPCLTFCRSTIVSVDCSSLVRSAGFDLLCPEIILNCFQWLGW